MLRQRSRVKWAAEGDENNRYFHGLIRGRLQRNSIKGLLSNGSWVESPTKIKETVFHYFSNQFCEPASSRPSFISSRFRKLSPSLVASLDSPFTESELKSAVWSCGDFKAPGPEWLYFFFHQVSLGVFEGGLYALR